MGSFFLLKRQENDVVKSLEDFLLTVEYKTSEKCNSGIFFRTNPKNPVQEGLKFGASVSLYKVMSLGLCMVHESRNQYAQPDDEWNTLVLTLSGPLIKIF